MTRVSFLVLPPSAVLADAVLAEARLAEASMCCDARGA